MLKNLINKIGTSKIRSELPQVPKTSVQSISNDSLSWELIADGTQIAPITLSGKKSIKDQNIFLQTNIKFKGFPATLLDSDEIKNADEKYADFFEWVQKKGLWKTHPAFFLSSPQPKTKSIPYFKMFNGIPIFWVPKEIQWMQSNEDWTNNGKISVDIYGHI